MKKILYSLCLAPILLWGQITESDQLQEVLPHVVPETWVFFDVDNTLIESSLHLGSSQWRGHIRQKIARLGYSHAEVENILDHFWFFVQQLIPVRSVDSDVSTLIGTLRDSNTVVLGLTARDVFENKHTLKQLASADIFLSEDFLPGSRDLSTAKPSLFDRGVIYSGENTKGETLLAFFQDVGYLPKKVIFVDDRMNQVVDVEKALEQVGVEFIGIRFSKADARVKAFNGDIADLQFSLLPRIISDEEAEALLVELQKN